MEYKNIYIIATLLVTNVFASEQACDTTPAHEFLFIEKIARSAVTQPTYTERQSQEERLSMEIEKRLKNIRDESFLYCLAVMLYECYPELAEAPDERVLFAAREFVVLQLAQCQTKKAYYYFSKLREMYGSASSEFLFLERKYFHKFSKDKEVIKALSPNQFI